MNILTEAIHYRLLLNCVENQDMKYAMGTREALLSACWLIWDSGWLKTADSFNIERVNPCEARERIALILEILVRRDIDSHFIIRSDSDVEPRDTTRIYLFSRYTNIVVRFYGIITLSPVATNRVHRSENQS
jgi:hypothetical protein